MMEDMSAAVALALGFGNAVCENSGISNHTGLKLVTETATLLLDPALMLDDSSGYCLDARNRRVGPETNVAASSAVGGRQADVDMLKTSHITEKGQLVCDVPESKENGILSSGEDHNVELLALDTALHISVSLDAASEASIPIVVEVKVKDKGPNKGGVKSVLELESVPLWGLVSLCGHWPRWKMPSQLHHIS